MADWRVWGVKILLRVFWSKCFSKYLLFLCLLPLLHSDRAIVRCFVRPARRLDNRRQYCLPNYVCRFLWLFWGFYVFWQSSIESLLCAWTFIECASLTHLLENAFSVPSLSLKKNLLIWLILIAIVLNIRSFASARTWFISPYKMESRGEVLNGMDEWSIYMWSIITYWS